MSKHTLSFVDLLCGCPAMTGLGMERAGFQCLAAIDFNAQAVATLRTNLHAHQEEFHGAGYEI